MPYDLNEMRQVFWRATGRQSESALSNLVVDGYLKSGASLVAAELDLPERTDHTSMPLEPDLYEYPLASNVLGVKDVYWNNRRLDFSSLAEWRQNNINYRNSTSGNPQYVAVEGRTLYIYPAPSADAISTDAALTTRVQLANGGVTPTGIVGFSDEDVLLACYAAALEYMAFDTSGRFANTLKSAEAFFKTRLEQAKIRYAEMLREHNPTVNMNTGRTGPAR